MSAQVDTLFYARTENGTRPLLGAARWTGAMLKPVVQSGLVNWRYRPLPDIDPFAAKRSSKPFLSTRARGATAGSSPGAPLAGAEVCPVSEGSGEGIRIGIL